MHPSSLNPPIWRQFLTRFLALTFATFMLTTTTTAVPIDDNDTSILDPSPLTTRSPPPSPPKRTKLKRSVNAGGVNVEAGLHQAAALGAMTLLMTAHRAVMNTGFTFSRSSISTDTTICITIVAIATFWTSIVLLSGFFVTDKPCRTADFDIERCLARAAHAPWMLQVISVFWLIGLLDAYLTLGSKAGKSPRLWRLQCSRGPFDWVECLKPWFRWVMVLTMFLIVGTTSYGALMERLYAVGILNVVGVILFAVGAGGSNKYDQAPHKYSGDMIRVVLGTAHSEGTTYILPSAVCGFDAVWSPKISGEHVATDEYIMSLFTTLRSGEWYPSEPLKRLRDVLTPFLRNISITPKELADLARWLYLSQDCPPEMRILRCSRPSGIHLIGRDLMYALCHAEYIVFMRRDQLPANLRDQWSMIRNATKSGGGGDHNGPATRGFQESGIKGYRDAVRWVYSLFDVPMDDAALNPTGFIPPTTSKVYELMGCKDPPSTPEEYISLLWDFSVRYSEGTVSALYIFTTILFIEVNNVGGFHIFPLRTKSRQGDMTAWHVIWRQGWYDCVLSQLVTMSPIILSAFVTGIFQ